jgi:hypothetical protein
VSGTDGDVDQELAFVLAQTSAVFSRSVSWDQIGADASAMTRVRGDVNGNFTPDFELQLAGNIALAATDFVL